MNTSLNRWAIEPNLAVTWLHPKSAGFDLGLVGFFFQQTTRDSCSRARLGAFLGQDLAIGPCVTSNGKIGKTPSV